MSNAENCPRCGHFTLEAAFGGDCPDCSAFEIAGAYILPIDAPVMRLRDWLFLAALVAANVAPWGLFAWGLTQ